MMMLMMMNDVVQGGRNVIWGSSVDHCSLDKFGEVQRLYGNDVRLGDDHDQDNHHPTGFVDGGRASTVEGQKFEATWLTAFEHKKQQVTKPEGIMDQRIYSKSVSKTPVATKRTTHQI